MNDDNRDTNKTPTTLYKKHHNSSIRHSIIKAIA